MRNPVEIEGELIEVRDKSICIVDGTMEDDPRYPNPDPETGEIRQRLKHFWLPKSQIEYEVVGKKVTVQVPQWLAEEKGLV